MGYFFIILYYGSQANDIDHKLKAELFKLAHDCTCIKEIARENLVYSDISDKGTVHLISQNTKKRIQYHGDPKGFTNENENVIAKVEVMEEAITKAIERLDYKIEFQSLSIFGFVINIDLIYNVGTLFIGAFGFII